MFIRQIHVTKNGKRHGYWALVESYRTEQGPRQRVVSYLKQIDTSGSLGIQYAAQGKSCHQKTLFDDVQPRWVEVDVNRMRIENCVDFGGPWLALQLIRKLELDTFLKETIVTDRAQIPWSVMALVLVICRLCDPSSELHIAEHSYAHKYLAGLSDKAPADYGQRLLDAMRDMFSIFHKTQELTGSCLAKAMEESRKAFLNIALSNVPATIYYCPCEAEGEYLKNIKRK